MDIVGISESNGAKLQIWEDVDGDNQKWLLDEIEKTEEIPILSKRTGKVIEVPGGNLNNGAVLQQWEDTNAKNQRWIFEKQEDDYYKITNKATGKVMDVKDAATANGSKVHQWDYVGADNQLWKLVDCGDGYYKIKSKQSGKCVDIVGISNQNGAQLQIWEDVDGDNQKWKIELEEENTDPPESPTLFGEYQEETAILTWTRSEYTDNYVVYTSTSSGGPYYVLQDKLTKTEYKDTMLSENKTYYYVVKAVNEYGESAYSNEVTLGSNVIREYNFDAEADDDKDGLTNTEELMHGTNTRSEDTDQDGLSDKKEIERGTNPLEPDTDGDGIYDGAEVKLGMNPCVPNEMKEVTREVQTKEENAQVKVVGNSNLIIAPVTLQETDHALLNSLEYLIGKPVEFETGGFPIESAKLSLSFTQEELDAFNLKEEELQLYWVNLKSKQLEPISNTVISGSKTSKIVSAHIEKTGSYLLGYKGMSVDLSQVDIVFCVDQSGSMETNDRLNYRVTAIRNFLKKLKEDSYKAGIVSFLNYAKKVQEITNDKEALLQALNRLRSVGGSTNMFEGIVTSADLFSAEKNRRKIIILLTDGKYTGTNPVPNAVMYCTEKGITINTVALGNNVNVENLKQIASLTKGSYFYINNEYGLSEKDVEKQINLIYEKLSKQITLSEEAKDDELPKSKSGLEFSDLYFGIESKEVEDWITTASTNLLTGNYIHTEADITLQGSGYPLTFERTYNSLSGSEDSMVGKGYRTNFDTKVEKKKSSDGSQILEGKVTASKLNVRSGAGTTYGIIGSLCKGKKITVTSTEQADGKYWYKINYKGKDGYVSGAYIDGQGGYEVTFSTGTKIFFTERENGTLEANNSTDVEFKKCSNGGYQITNKDFSKQIYNEMGKLISLEDKHGNSVTITYENGKISKVKDTAGKKLEFTYGSNGYLSKLKAPLNRTIQYQYDEQKHLTAVTDMAENKTKYEYDATSGLMKKVIDANGNQVVQNDYDVLGRIVRQYDGNDIIRYFIYDDVLEEENQGISARYSINENGKEEKVTYSADLRSVLVRDALGGQTNYKYEYYNQEKEKWIDITTKEADSAVWLEYNDYSKEHKVAQRETVTDKNGNKTITEKDKNGNIIKVTDAKGNIVESKYDSHNNLIQQMDAKGNKTAYEYDANQINLTKQTDAKGNTKTFTYYEKGQDNILLGGLLKSETDHRGNITKYQYKDAANNVTKIVDALNHSISYTYDQANRKSSETDGNQNTTEYVYDNMDRCITKEDALGEKSETKYDKIGNVVEEIDPLGAVTKYEYDKKNNLVKMIDAQENETSYKYDYVGNKIKEIDANGNITTYEYDALDRMILETDSLDGEIRYQYDKEGNKIYERNQNGQITEYQYNTLNQLTEISKNGKHFESYTYDANGNITAIENARGYTTQKEYDKLNREIKVVDEEGSTTKAEYFDAEGKIIVTDAKQNKTTKYLDALGREYKLVDALGGVTKTNYDANGNETKIVDALGRETEYTYDALNRKIKENYKYKENGISKDCIQTFTYDAVGNIIKEVNANGGVTTKEYDKTGNLIKVITPLAGCIQYTYDALGNEISVTDANGGTVRKTYDALARVLTETDPEGNQTTYTYDAVGNITSKTDAKKGKETYQYDALNYLTEVKDALGNKEEMTYDLLGNNLSKKDKRGNETTYSYDKANRLKTAKDALGNSISYRYDAVGNQITVVDAKGNVLAYEYDGNHQKVKEIDQIGNETLYTYDKGGKITQKQDRKGCICTGQAFL